MAILPLQLARVSNYLRSNQSLGTIATTQRQLMDVQNQLATGVRLNAPSDDPGAAQIAIQLQRTLERRTAYSDAITAGKSRLNSVDSTLGDVTALLQQVQSLASANVGSDVTADQRSSAASVARSIYNQMLTQANRQTGGMYLFGGDRGNSPPYIEAGGGVKFVGSSAVLRNLVDDSTSVDISVDGTAIFGGASSAVQGADLQPGLTTSTRLSDLGGAQSFGVRPGSIFLSDGTSSRTIDLSSADTMQDVMDAVNASGLATATLSGRRLTLTPVAPTGDLVVQEVGGNHTAGDLGILTPTGPGAGTPITGTSVAPKLTGLTPLSVLFGGGGLVVNGGFRISNGTANFDVSLSGPPAATTVQDVLNAVNRSGSGALARINAAGNGIDIVNPTQGTALSVTELGGTVAAQLGVRSFSTATPLSALNSGRGIQTGTGADIEIVARNGTAFSVDVDGAVTVQDVLDRINTATGGSVTASFTASPNNGIVLTDTTGGGGALTVRSQNFSTAANDLGIAGTSNTTTLQGRDVNPVRSNGVFDNLQRLIGGLVSNNAGEITAAAEGLKNDLAKTVRARGDVGAKVKELEAREDSLADQNVATQSLLSEIRDTDYPSAIARFQLLQTTLQANYQTTSRVTQQSLLDFLR